MYVYRKLFYENMYTIERPDIVGNLLTTELIGRDRF